MVNKVLYVKYGQLNFSKVRLLKLLTPSVGCEG